MPSLVCARFAPAFLAVIFASGLSHGAALTVVSEMLRTPIKQCRVCTVSGLDTCNYTDDSGGVKLPLPASASIQFVVSASGHCDTLFSISPGEAFPDTIVLKVNREEYQLPKIVVTAVSSKNANSQYTESSTRFTPNDIKTAAGAVEDIGRYIGTLPSTVASIGEGYDNTFFVRGGRPSEVVFLVDGIEMENINHFSKANGSGGPIGFINSDYLESVNFYAGNMPVGAPSRLSSIVDIRMKNGSFSDSKRYVGCKLTGGMMAVEGPLAAEKSSIALAGRYVDFMPLHSFIKDAGIPKLGDMYGKLVFLPGDDIDVALTGIFSYNIYRYEYPFLQPSDQGVLMNNAMTWSEKIVQGGAGISVRLQRGVMSHEAHLSLSLRNGADADSLSSFSDPFFTSHYASNPVDRDRDDRRHLMLTTASQMPIDENSALSFGVRLNRNDYSFFRSNESKHEGTYIFCNHGCPDTLVWQHKPIERGVRFDAMESGGHLGFYREFGDLQAQAGLRADCFHVLNAMAFSPRLSVSYQTQRMGAVTASWGLYHQFPTDMPTAIFDYFSSDQHLPQDTLQSGQTRFLKQLLPQRCWQTSCGYDRTLFGLLETKAEAYYKWYDREYTYLDPAIQDVFAVNQFGAVTMQPQNGRRRAYGVELTAQDRHDRRYFYSVSGSLFDVKNQYGDGTWRDDWTDVRYTFSLSGSALLFDHHLFSASVRGSGGRPLCAQAIAVDCMGRKSAVLDTTAPYFSRRLDPLLSVNLKYSFTHKIGGVGVETFLEVLNLFDYKPTLEYKFNGDRFIEVKPFGITPIIGCTLQL